MSTWFSTATRPASAATRPGPCSTPGTPIRGVIDTQLAELRAWEKTSPTTDLKD